MTWTDREIARITRDCDVWRRKVARARHPDPRHVEYVQRLQARIDEMERQRREEEQP